MKKIFPGFYRPTEKEFSNLWASCLFVLDANAILNLYRYSPETSNDLIQILNQVSERLWVPHQAALEYQRNRLQTIASQLQEYDNIKKIVEDSKNNLKIKLDSLSKRPSFIEADKLMKIMQKACNAIEKNLRIFKEAHLELLQNDNLRDALDALFEDKLGLHYSQEKLNEIYKLGEERYEQEIPPGYEDKNKEGIKKYGDLILWFQIIDKAKEANEAIILITDERKEDWWTKIRGKIIGPRPELTSEMLSEAGVSFYLYQTYRFMENAKKFLKQQVKKKAIDEVREIRERDEELEQILKKEAMAKFDFSDQLRGINELSPSIKLSEAISSALVEKLSPSIKLSEAISSALVEKLSPSIKLSEAISSAIQETKSSYSIPKKDREQAKDGNLSTDFEPEEIDKNEKDCQKENEVGK